MRSYHPRMSTSTRIGSEIAGYRLEALLGRGGMSVVYVAEHLRLGRKVALKLLAPALSHDESFRERFDRESRRAAEIDHPNIIPIYDAGEADGQLYIAMRYVIGSDLKTLIEQEGPLGVGRTLFILEQAAGGLDAAHARDLVHRDVKPANILIEQPSEHVYLTDFGVVKHTAASQGLTRTGLFIGTVDYAAPEQIEGLEVDARTDVYALGCVLYECLIGKGPFDRQGEVAVMHAHLTEAPPRLTGVRPDLPKGLDQVVERAMAKDRKSGTHRARSSRLPPVPRLSADWTEARPLPDEAPSQAPDAAAAVGAAGAAAAAASVAGAPAAESIAPLAHQTAAPPTEQPASAVTEQPVPPVAEQPSSAGVSQAGPPPPPPPGSSGGGDRRRLILIAAIAAGLAAAAAAVAVYFATRSDGSEDAQASGPATVTVTQPEGATEPSSPATPPAEPPPAETAPPAAEPSGQLAPLETLVPADIWADCAAAPAPLEPGAQESAVCASPAGETRRFDQLEISVFADGASTAAAYEALKNEAGVQPDSGRCGATRWTGEGPWNHGTPDNPGGRRFCYFDGNEAVIVWTHDKLGQDTHVDTLGIARAAGSAHSDLFRWWDFWHHEIGKIPS